MRNLLKIIFILGGVPFFIVKCTSVEKQSTESFSSAEEEDFLDEEEEDLVAELEDPPPQESVSAPAEETVVDQETQQEQEAESELEDIEGEFNAFADEEDEVQEATSPTEELPTQQEASLPENTAEQESGVEENLENEEIADIQTGEPEILEESSFPDQGGFSTEGSSRITNIRYEQGSIYIDTVGGEISYRSRFNEATKQLIIEFPQTVIVDQLKWPYIMKEFLSDFALLQADQKTPDIVRVIIQMKPGSITPLIVQKDAGFVISPAGVDLTKEESVAQDFGEGGSAEGAVLDETLTAEEGGGISEDIKDKVLQAQTIEEFLIGEHKFYGGPITLDVRDANLKDILYFLAEDTGINMIVSDKIPNQKISIRLQEIPWDQALVLIMKHKKLGYIRKGNVITISTLGEIKEERRELTNLIKEQEKFTPLKFEIVPIAYAQAAQIANQIKGFKTPRGTIEVDSAGNSLILYDTQEAIENMKKLVLDLDRTPKQVMIAAKIVEVQENFSREFGISWRLSGESFPISVGPLGNLNVTSQPFIQALPGNPNTGIFGSNFTIGTFKGIGDLDAQLGLAETEGVAHVLSAPRIMALNGQAASVNQSSENIAFSAVTTESGTQTQVQRSPVTLSLSVTPEITNVDSIYMQVSMNRSFAGAPVGSADSVARPTNSRSANTRILIRSGQTAVIGGIYETEKTTNIDGFPILKHIPIVNWLFSKRFSENSKRELLLFLTPRIIDIGSEDSVESAASSQKRRVKEI